MHSAEQALYLLLMIPEDTIKCIEHEHLYVVSLWFFSHLSFIDHFNSGVVSAVVLMPNSPVALVVSSVLTA